MNIQDLLARFDVHRGSFPAELVAEIIARREEAIPELLNILADIDSNPGPWLADRDEMRHIYAMYLLAFFREQRAYPLLIRVFSRPGEFAFDLIGDIVTEDLDRMLASVFDGDTSGMTALIENENANEWVRSAALNGMVNLVTSGQQTREEVMAYFLQLFQKLERKTHDIWATLACVCTDLWPHEAMTQLEAAFEEDLIDESVIDWEDIEKALAIGQERAMQGSRYRDPIIVDLAKDMSWMSCFSDRELEEEDEWDLEDPELFPAPIRDYIPGPIVRTEPKIGRNEACTCGSGKKYKKCCGVN